MFGKAVFYATHFNGDAFFENAVFSGAVSFRSASFRILYFSSTEATGRPQFINDIDLLGCTYDRIQVNWRSLLNIRMGNLGYAHTTVSLMSSLSRY